MIASLSMNGGGSGGSRVGRGLALHRSNSSLELPHSPDPACRVPETPLRREYGSHGTDRIFFQTFSFSSEESEDRFRKYTRCFTLNSFQLTSYRE